MSRRPAADRPWTEEERAWARECFDAGDSVAEVASWARRRRADVRREFAAEVASVGQICRTAIKACSEQSEGDGLAPPC